MKKIKIISNPYEKTILFSEWDMNEQKWKEIYDGVSDKGRLIRDDIKNGFFPFKVAEIVDIIKDEFYINDKIEIYFEGTSDEYQELEALLNSEKHGAYFELHKGERYLNNARDILPDIRNIFENKIWPLVDENIEDRAAVEEDTKKFADAANEIIPICVLGTYSVGKSTFVNALIGREILPSAEKPTTAKVYKISEASEDDRAEIKMTYNDEDISIVFEGTDVHIKAASNELIERIEQNLKEVLHDDIYVMLKETLELINDCSKEECRESIGDAINISVPFKGGLWKDSANKFVIFDTPGSNSASNETHLKVLKRELEGLTNGIPVFVTKFDQLDTTDNAKLYDEISTFEELDQRFTMIVINKADESKLPKDGFDEEDIEDILHQEIPREMYRGGIYFISSIMGLGSKNNGDFLDDHSGEIFEDQRNKYVNPESKYYKTLYKYNIMPVQLKDRLMTEALEQEDKMFSNSGCYSVEKEIQTFANKYSAYNKCTQSNIFLGKVIDTTTQDIELNTNKKDEDRAVKDEAIKEDSDRLIQEIGTLVINDNALTNETLTKLIEDSVQRQIEKYTFDEIWKLSRQLKENKKDLLHVDKERKDVFDTLKNTGENLMGDVADALKDKDLDKFKDFGKDFKEGIKSAYKETDEWIKANEEVKKLSRSELQELVRDRLDYGIHYGKEYIEAKSIEYLENRTMEIKNNLIELIRGSENISIGKRKELEEIVINYPKLELTKDAGLIDSEKLKNKIVVVFESTLQKQFNDVMDNEMKLIGNSIGDIHYDNFDYWLSMLENTIIDDIENYSPALHKQRQEINDLTAKITKLRNCRRELINYREAIESKMRWI